MIDYRWSVFWATLDPAVGSEQAGRRPVLVVSAEEVNQNLPIVTVLPMTSMRPNRKVYPTEVLLARDIAQLDRDSLVLAHQIRTISKSRLGERLGRVDDPCIRAEVQQAIGRHFGFGW